MTQKGSEGGLGSFHGTKNKELKLTINQQHENR